MGVFKDLTMGFGFLGMLGVIAGIIVGVVMVGLILLPLLIPVLMLGAFALLAIAIVVCVGVIGHYVSKWK